MVLARLMRLDDSTLVWSGSAFCGSSSQSSTRLRSGPPQTTRYSKLK